MNENIRILVVLGRFLVITFCIYLLSVGVYGMLSYNGGITTGTILRRGLTGGRVMYSYSACGNEYEGVSGLRPEHKVLGDSIDVFYSKRFPWISSTYERLGVKVYGIIFPFFVLGLGWLILLGIEREYEICNSSVIVRSGDSSRAVDITVEEE
jgi:hypothetical protein